MIVKKTLVLGLFLIICLFLGGTTTGKLDYHLEESPAVSWNGIHIYDARQMALAGISMMASKPFSASMNPAVMDASEQFSLGINFNRAYFEAFQYWGINQGVEAMTEPFQNTLFTPGGLAGTANFGKFRLSAGWYLSNILEFPSFEYINEYDYSEYDTYSGIFSGKENTLFVAAAFSLGSKLDIGLKLDYVFGERNVDLLDFSHYYYRIDDEWQLRNVRIEQRESHRISTIVPTLGAQIKISPRFIISTALVYPLKGKAKRTISRSFINDSDGVNISSNHDSHDDYYRPKKLILGTTFLLPITENSSFKRGITFAAESNYIFWSDYKYIFFEETIPRDLKNVMVLALGIEYSQLSTTGGFSLRAGFRLDPQPVAEPNVVLKVFSAGVGLRFGAVCGDLGISYYTGSPAGIHQNHFLISGGLSLLIKGGEK